MSQAADDLRDGQGPTLPANRCPHCGTQVKPGEPSCRNCRADFGADATVVSEAGASATPIPVTDKVAKELAKALSPRIQLIRRLAGGGMSRVYLGRDPGLRRLVAIKVLSDELAKDPLARTRFAREAEAAASIVDPHVIDIYQVGTLPRSNKPYIIMQFVDGLTLQQEILTGKLVPVAVAKAVVGEVASALAAAHARSVVHRDIKPANIIIDRETNRAIVLDFGISAALDPSVRGGERLTMVGVSVGTPTYMSPEQAAAKPVTDRSDVYSLGVMAFELVTGELPFRAQAPEAFLAAHLQETPPDVRTLRPDLDEKFANIINRCLAKRPAERPAAREIARALIPSARLAVEWPPPGLTALLGMGRKQLRVLVATVGLGLGFFILSLFAGQTTAPLLDPTGPAQGHRDTASVWIFLLTMAVLGTAISAALALFHGWRLATLVRRGRGLEYPWPVVLDVALAGPDTTALINGYAVFALLPEATRGKLLRLRRLSAGAVVVATLMALSTPPLWLTGALGSTGSGAGSLVATGELMLLFLPAVLTFLVAAALFVPEWRVRNRGRQWQSFLPVSWSIPPVQLELVSGWLSAVGRDPLPLSDRFPRWVAIWAPLAGGAVLSAILLVSLSAALTVAATTSRWARASRPLAVEWLGEPTTAASWSDLTELVASAARLPSSTGRVRGVPDGLADQMVTGVASALSNEDTTAATEGIPHRSWWRRLPRALPQGAVAVLISDTDYPPLGVWRRVANARSSMTFWVYDEEFSELTVLESDLPLFPQGEAARLARKNESSALLAMARGRQRTALLRARENIAVGHKLLNDPINGWLAHGAIESGRLIIREVGLIVGDRGLLLEAERLQNALGSPGAMTRPTVGMGSALMADPTDPVGLRVVGDSTRAPYVRWWLMAGIVPGYCGNAREVLFGVDPRRREILARAGALAGDIPHTDEWMRLNERWLDAWITSAARTGRSTEADVPGPLVPLRWIGLGGLVARIGYCRAAARQFDTA